MVPLLGRRFRPLFVRQLVVTRMGRDPAGARRSVCGVGRRSRRLPGDVGLMIVWGWFALHGRSDVVFERPDVRRRSFAPVLYDLGSDPRGTATVREVGSPTLGRDPALGCFMSFERSTGST